MTKYDVSLEAIEDLYNIWEYTVDTWSEQQADTYYAILEHSFTDIAEDPEHCGKPYNEIYPGLRALHVSQHMVFYVIQTNGKVLIVRILHEQMDYARHF